MAADILMRMRTRHAVEFTSLSVCKQTDKQAHGKTNMHTERNDREAWSKTGRQVHQVHHELQRKFARGGRPPLLGLTTETLFFEFLWMCFLSARPRRPQSLIWLFQMGQKKHDNEIKKYENCFLNQDARFGTEPWQRVRGRKHLQRIRREMSSSCCPWLILTCTKKHWLPSCQCLQSQPCASQLNSKLVTGHRVSPRMA